MQKVVWSDHLTFFSKTLIFRYFGLSNFGQNLDRLAGGPKIFFFSKKPRTIELTKFNICGNFLDM